MIVGKGAQSANYFVHKSLLLAASDFFATALNGKFKEGDTQTIELPEDKVQTFEDFVAWLYHPGNVHLRSDRLFKNEENNVEMRRLLDLYVFADKLGIALKNQIITSIHTAAKERFNLSSTATIKLPHPSFVQQVYTTTPAGSGFGRIMIAMYVDRLSSGWLLEQREQLAEYGNVATDLAIALFLKIEGRFSPFAKTAKVDQFLDKAPDKPPEKA